MRLRKPHLFILTIAALMLFASAAQGGDGSVVPGPPHLLNLYLYYTYDETDLQVMRDAFQEA